MSNEITITEEQFKKIASEAITDVVMNKLFDDDVSPDDAANATLDFCEIVAKISKKMFMDGD